MRHKSKKQLFILFIIVLLAGSVIGVLVQNKTEENASASATEEITTIDQNKIIVEPLQNDIKIIRPEANKITTGEQKITFSGMADPKIEVKLNNEPIDVYYTGNFILEAPLTIGSNSFNFTLGDKSLNYEVIRQDKIIDSIIPNKTLMVEGGMQAEIKTKLYSGATAYAEINGEKIELVQIESDEFISARDTTYATFKGIYNVPKVDKELVLDNIIINALYNGEKASKKGGKIIINKSLEKGTEAIIKNDIAWVYNYMNTSVTPMVDMAPLAKGTRDYITSKIIVDTKEYYNLASKKRVRSEDVEIIQNQEELENNIKAISVFQQDNKTILKLKPSSKLPYNMDIVSVDYKDISTGDYSVEEFKPKEINISFDYIKDLDNEVDFNENFLFDSIQVKEKDGNKYLNLTINDDINYSGHFAYYDNEGNLIVEFKNQKSTIKDMIIVIDPGHGLIENYKLDSGALGWSGINENTINTNISKFLEEGLLEKGAHILRLDTEKENLPLKTRGAKAREYNADLYLSIHNNSGGSGKYNGTETYYNTPYSKNFAKNINYSLVDCYNNNLFKGIDGDYNRGVKFNDYTVTLERENPSVLIEVGYIDNPLSFNKIIDSDYQKKLAESIIKGLENSL
ncbi:N-acetylmuramoyl-L-alanine amidase [Clostridium vincentii]|uniref:N-acetylmuramoyl-L-alanine amidase LytC n=1 Tax=Clostridium vincentii TaxID=52704 RepID=A0A2T0BB37_9CLOT|nr:N-acetylmuramoyl-L-alanine amidase [Clostridium vincentii]PRR81094.1 N-acetylmuramoyl-L-alanine amidase LytC precursor [Clostridium vincentii]